MVWWQRGNAPYPARRHLPSALYSPLTTFVPAPFTSTKCFGPAVPAQAGHEDCVS